MTLQHRFDNVLQKVGFNKKPDIDPDISKVNAMDFLQCCKDGQYKRLLKTKDIFSTYSLKDLYIKFEFILGNYIAETNDKRLLEYYKLNTSILKLETDIYFCDEAITKLRQHFSNYHREGFKEGEFMQVHAQLLSLAGFASSTPTIDNYPQLIESIEAKRSKLKTMLSSDKKYMSMKYGNDSNKPQNILDQHIEGVLTPVCTKWTNLKQYAENFRQVNYSKKAG